MSSDVFSAIVSIDINNQLILSCVPIMIRTSLIQIPIFSICNMLHLNLSFDSSPEMKHQGRRNVIMLETK